MALFGWEREWEWWDDREIGKEAEEAMRKHERIKNLTPSEVKKEQDRLLDEINFLTETKEWLADTLKREEIDRKIDEVEWNLRVLHELHEWEENESQ